jgi:hypothetical protein
MRKVHTNRYSKWVPGHHIQMDVKFPTFGGNHERRIKRYQFTAIDDAARVRAMKIYRRHNQANAIDFVDHVIDKFPFRIREIRTDNVLCRENLAVWISRSWSIRLPGRPDTVAQTGSAVKK